MKSRCMFTWMSLKYILNSEFYQGVLFQHLASGRVKLLRSKAHIISTLFYSITILATNAKQLVSQMKCKQPFEHYYVVTF